MIRGHLNLHPNSTTLTDVTRTTLRTSSPNATFWRTLKCGNSAWLWNTKPTPRRCGGTCWIGLPSSTISPRKCSPVTGPQHRRTIIFDQDKFSLEQEHGHRQLETWPVCDGHADRGSRVG